MSAAPDTPVRAGCPRWVKLVLTVSLAANLAVVGVYVGHEMTERDRSRGAARQIDWIVKMVPEDRRAFTEAHFADIRAEVTEARRARREDMSGVVEAIRADPYVPEALDAAISEMRSSYRESRRKVKDGFVSLLAEFTAEERAAFAERLQARLERKRARRGGDDGD